MVFCLFACLLLFFSTRRQYYGHKEKQTVFVKTPIGPDTLHTYVTSSYSYKNMKNKDFLPDYFDRPELLSTVQDHSDHNVERL